MSQTEKSFEAFIGTEVGTFKHFTYKSNQVKDLIDPKTVQTGDEILRLTWADPSQTTVLLGQRNGIIKEYSLDTNQVKEKTKVKVHNETLVGLEKYGKFTVTAVASGMIRVWKKRNPFELNAGENLECMRGNCFANEILATGGNENALKLWDLTTQCQVFIAKNVPHDMLQLRVPIRVSDICFLTSNTVATASRLNVVSLYDIRAQRRPVCRVEVENSAFSCLSSAAETSVVCGGGKGLINAIDLRKPGRVLHKYKGPLGAVRDIHVQGKHVISVCLDRKLRVHEFDSTRLVAEKYLKTRCVCVLVKEVDVLVDVEDIKEETDVSNAEICNVEDNGDILLVNEKVYDDSDGVESEQEVVENTSGKRKKSEVKKNKRRKNGR